MENNTNIRLAVPFFMVADIDASLLFYVEKLGFKLAKTWVPQGRIEWCWLTRDEVSLMLQESKKEQWKDKEKGEGVSICFQCEDAIALYHEFRQRGVALADPFVGNQMWVVSVKDPDGYRLDFESPTDTAEGIVYTDWIKKAGV